MVTRGGVDLVTYSVCDREPTAEKAAVEVALELLPHEPRQCELHSAVVDGAVEGLEVVLDDPVERRRFRAVMAMGVVALAIERGRGGRRSG